MPTWVSFAKTSGSGSFRLELDELDANGNLIRTDVLETIGASTSGFARVGLTGVFTDRRCVRIRPAFRLTLCTGTAYVFAPHPGHSREVGATEPQQAAVAAATGTDAAIINKLVAIAVAKGEIAAP